MNIESSGMHSNQGSNSMHQGSSSINIADLINKLKQNNEKNQQKIKNINSMLMNGNKGSMTISGGNKREMTISGSGMEINNQASQGIAHQVIEHSENMHGSHGGEMTINSGSSGSMNIDGNSLSIGKGANREVAASWNQNHNANAGEQS
jgi:hypothetical protein